MNKKVILSLLLICVPLLLPAKPSLPPQYQDWLDTVGPIITKLEKRVFLQLNTNGNRDKFINLFWKRRDPLPDTERNEFKEEYLERVNFADKNFSHGTSLRGSQTERGYFYVLLGPPLERTRFETISQLWPQELWYYKSKSEWGLPSFFYLIFYQAHGLGEYRLYYPGIEGPEKLVVPDYYGSRTVSRTAAYQEVKKIAAELANASLSYIPGEAVPGMMSLSSNSLLANIRAVPEKIFTDSYARTFLDFKDYVETEYSHNFNPSHVQVKLFEQDGLSFLHWSLEPSKMNFGFHNNRHYASFQLLLRMEDEKGNLILEKEEEIPLEVTPEQLKKHERRHFAFQDILPVIPGNFTLFFLLKNKTGQDFTSFKTDVFIPGRIQSAHLSNIFLYHNTLELPAAHRNKLRAFTFNGKQYLFNAQNNFLTQENLGLVCQVHNLAGADGRTALIEILPLAGDTALHSVRKPLREVMSGDGMTLDSGPLPLSSIKPGYYRAALSILDSRGNKILYGKENFVLLSQPYSVIPWVYARMHKGTPNKEHIYLLASQYFLSRQYNPAERLVRRSLEISRDPGSVLLLAKILFAGERFNEALSTAVPLYEGDGNSEAAKIAAVCHVRLGQWSSALIYLEELLKQATELSVLNLAAECYLRLEQPEKALPLLEKSLQLNPGQKDILEKKKRAEESVKR
jgi:GWxTD domain-containing protein